ncbi:hypothetical protein AB2L57_09385 [Microbacterium sp. HA-8]|uniref:hypothetical protein n=1 Tax=Microbacterium sp. HA-8 TaxID=3234200 RepID=UPI0038F798D7
MISSIFTIRSGQSALVALADAQDSIVRLIESSPAYPGYPLEYEYSDGGDGGVATHTLTSGTDLQKIAEELIAELAVQFKRDSSPFDAEDGIAPHARLFMETPTQADVLDENGEEVPFPEKGLRVIIRVGLQFGDRM